MISLLQEARESMAAHIKRVFLQIFIAFILLTYICCYLNCLRKITAILTKTPPTYPKK